MSTTTSADGVRIAYEVGGEGDPSIVFVHGWCCDRTYFAPQFVHFARRRRVASLDLRGHGQSAHASNYTIERFADDVRAVIAAANLPSPIAVGHSMGAAVAVALAATGDARAAVLVDPAPLVGPLKGVLGDLARGPFADDAAGDARAAFADAMFLPSDDADRRRRIVASMSAAPLDVATASMLALETFDGEAALRACTVPLLSIGAANPVNDPASLRALAPDILIGQTVGAGHFNQVEVPDQVNAMIERFVEVVVTRSR